jgi:glycosyltransferase involved in cell wall biosynthesis
MEKKPPVVLSFLGATNLQVIIAGTGVLERLAISERNDPAMQQLKVPWQQLRKSLYRSADIITANSMGAIQTMRAFVPSDKLAYVPNPVFCSSPRIDLKGRQKVILTVARLVQQKGLDVLIKAVAHISDQIPDWRVEIVGDGPIEDVLKRFAGKRGVAEKFKFCGYQENVDNYYRYASIFALPSRYEGTPNALIEAMTFGLPAIVSDSSPGPLELVNHGLNGLVFPSEDAQSLASAILLLTENEEMRIAMGSASREISNKFSSEEVFRQWDKIIYGN